MEFARVDVNLGYRCNNRCRFCLHGEKRDTLPPPETEAAKALLTAAREQSDRLLVTGGEPSIRPDYHELLAHIRDLDFAHVTLETNGRMFSYRPFTQKSVASAVVDVYQVAVQGHTKELHEYLTGIHDSFKQTLGGIQQLKGVGGTVHVRTVLHRSNYRHLTALLTLLQRLRIDGIHLSYPEPTGGIDEDFIRQAPRFALISPYVTQVLTTAYEGGLTADVEGMPLCHLQGYESYAVEGRNEAILRLDQEGEVIWSPETRRALKEEGDGHCLVCAGKPNCEGVWQAYIDHYGWAESEFADDLSDIEVLPYGTSATEK